MENNRTYSQACPFEHGLLVKLYADGLLAETWTGFVNHPLTTLWLSRASNTPTQ
jgi:hypothetical protein